MTMSQTEKLFQEALKIARKAFADPSESAVMDVFHELVAERDRMGWAVEGLESATVH